MIKIHSYLHAIWYLHKWDFELTEITSKNHEGKEIYNNLFLMRSKKEDFSCTMTKNNIISFAKALVQSEERKKQKTAHEPGEI